MSLLLLLFEALGGLGLLLLGMRTMSGGIQKLAGSSFRQFLEKLAGNRFASVGVGGILSAVMQSSTAASVLVVGLVNSGLLSLYQALGVLLGTGIGTTLAVRFFSFKVSIIALPFIFIGVVLIFFATKRRWGYTGEILLGMGLVFLGMRVMEANFVPLKDNVVWGTLQLQFTAWPITAVFLGALLSFFAQSGFTALAIIMTLASGGLLSLEAGVAMAIGEVVGAACITGVAAIGGTTAAKKSAIAFILMNMTSALLTMALFPFFVRIVTAFGPSGSTVDPLQISNAHSLFILITILLFLPLLPLIVRIFHRQSEKELEPRTKFLDVRVVNTPSIALSQAKNEIKRMATIAESMFNTVIEQFYDYDAARVHSIRQKEETLDVLQREIAAFLVLLSQRPLPAEVSGQIPYMINMINDLERFGDYTESILDYLRRKKEDNIFFSDTAMNELKIMGAEVAKIIHLANASYGGQKEDLVERAATIRSNIILLHETMKNNHINRLRTSKCSVMGGLAYSDIMIALQKTAECSYHIIEAAGELR